MTRRKHQGFWLSSVVMGAMTLFACNAITGADDVQFDDDDDDGGSQVASSGNGSGSGVTTGGMGGMAGVGGGATNGTGVTSGAGAGPQNCTYPPGPYGVDQGEVVPPTISWQGYAPGASSPTTITTQDLFDCDGSRGIHAVIVDTSQYG